MSAIHLVRLPNRPHDWGALIREFTTKTFFQEAAWLDFLLAANPGSRIDYFEIKRGGTTIGYFCALRRRKFIFSFYPNVWFGTTAYQVPLINGIESQADVVSALISASRSARVQTIELRNDWLEPEVMQRLGFRVTTGSTHLCPLPRDEISAWNAMRGTCRTRIRKARKEGLVAEVTTDDAIVDQFYSFYRNTLKAKGLVPAHPIDIYRALVKRLTLADRLIVVCVKFEANIIGVGLYAHDERAMHYLEGASEISSLHLCPNELLHWTAMKTAIGRGIPAFDVGGGPAPSRFSQKFGGDTVTYHEFSKSLNPWIDPAKFLYGSLRRAKNRIRQASVAFALASMCIFADAYAWSPNAAFGGSGGARLSDTVRPKGDAGIGNHFTSCDRGTPPPGQRKRVTCPGAAVASFRRARHS